jgi:hypothetical protein
VSDRAAEFGLKAADVGIFLAELERLHAVVKENSTIKLAIPVAPHRVWQPFLDELDHMGERVAAAGADVADDLRKRMVRCSFAECDFSDSVHLCVSFANALVGEEIRRRGWVKFPDRADFAWGIMFVC